MKNNLVKILGTFGLIIAIALILKGVFGVGKIGFKEISKTSEFPILKCVSDNNGKIYVDIIDLQNIKDKEPAECRPATATPKDLRDTPLVPRGHGGG